MGEIRRGCIARCSLGMLGLVTSETKVTSRYGNQAWLGVQLSPERAGHEWCSQNPTFVAESIGALEKRRWVVQAEKNSDLSHFLDALRRASPPIVLEVLDMAGNVTYSENMLPGGESWLREHEADLLRSLGSCARGWARDAMLVGNVQAGEVVDLCEELLKRGA